jgi:outer membrane protein assembly factor BamB
MTRFQRLAFAVLALPTVCSALPPPRGNPPGNSKMDWPKYCGNPAMTGYAASEIVLTRKSVVSLRPRWIRRLEGPIASSPSVAGARLYIGDWAGKEWALDAATGAVLSSADLGRTEVSVCNPPALGITSAPLVEGSALYLAGGDDAFYALDPSDLRTLWRVPLGDNSPSGGYYGWCSPAPGNGGLVLQGVSSNCDNPFVEGRLVGIETSSGALLDQVDLSETTDPAHYGAGVWTSPAVDVDEGHVFLTTGSAYHYQDGEAYSILRLSLSDLTVEDRWKIPLADYESVGDADWGSSPTLFSDSLGHLLVGAGHKDGHYYAFVRDDLSEGPVWTASVAVGGPCPQCGEGTISTAAFDGRRLYVGGGVPTGNASRTIHGSVVALDPTTGDIVWRALLFEPVLAPISAAPGLVFAVSGHSVLALDADSGAVLWSFDMEATGYGGIAISRGTIYVGDMSGNLYAFSTDRPHPREGPNQPHQY